MQRFQTCDLTVLADESSDLRRFGCDNLILKPCRFYPEQSSVHMSLSTRSGREEWARSIARATHVWGGMSRSNFRSAQFTERFECEARSIAALNHPNICHLCDVGPNYLVMELIEGEALKGPVRLDTALDYARQIADALDAAHEKGIIHHHHFSHPGGNDSWNLDLFGKDPAYPVCL